MEPVSKEFCDERSGDIERRITTVESVMESLRQALQKQAIMLGSIVGGISLIGIIITFALQLWGIHS
jgi:hypothetical protein